MSATATDGPATGQAQQAGEQAKDMAEQVRTQARDRVRDQVDQRSTQAGEQAGSAAGALRKASEQLRDDGNEPVAKGMEQVAERVESAGGWLRDSDGDTLLRDVEDFSRRNPLAVVAGGLALGFAASRLLKASSRDRYESSRALPTTGGTPPATPREGVLPDGGITGGTPATSPEATQGTRPASWQGGLGGEGEGTHRV